MEVLSLFWRSLKWRFTNPETIIMTLVQPLIWLFFFSTLFGSSTVFSDLPGGYTTFLLPGILVMVVITTGGFSGIANYASKSSGSFFRICISPVRKRSIVFGHLLDAQVVAFIESFVVLAASYGLSVRIQSGPVGIIVLFGILFSSVCFVAGFSFFLSLLIRNENGFIAVVNTCVLPFFFVSTALMPLDQMPPGFRIPVQLNPFTYIINSLRMLITEKTIHWISIAGTVTMLMILSLLSIALAVFAIHRETSR